MKNKRVFYVRMLNGYKIKVDCIYEYYSVNMKNGNQRLIFHKQPYENGYAITDSKTGTSILRGLNKMTKLNFIKICKLVLCLIDVTKYQENFSRVSKLKLYKGE